MDCLNEHGPMEERAVFDVHIDTCLECQGTWLDAGELGRSMHAPGPVEEALRKRMVTGALDMERDCPRCSTPLSRAHIDGAHLHTCLDCSGLWLESDVKEALRERAKTGMSAATVGGAAIIGTDVVAGGGESVVGTVAEGAGEVVGEGVAWVAESAVELLIGIIGGLFEG